MDFIRPAYSPPKKTKEEIYSYSNYNKNYLVKNYLVKNYFIKNYLVKNYLIITANIIITYLMSYLLKEVN